MDIFLNGAELSLISMKSANYGNEFNDISESIWGTLIALIKLIILNEKNMPVDHSLKAHEAIDIIKQPSFHSDGSFT